MQAITTTADGKPAPTLEFPCEFPIKLFYRPEDGIEALFEQLLREELTTGASVIPKRHDSAQGRFACLTLTFQADSKEQVLRIGQKLKSHPAVLMAL
jgi:hypothetical protein